MRFLSKCRMGAMVTAAVCLLSPAMLLSQTTARAQDDEQRPEEIALTETAPALSFFDEQMSIVKNEWGQLTQALAGSEFVGVTEHFDKILEARSLLGNPEFDDYAREMISAADRMASSGKREEAAFLAHKGLGLAPGTTDVVLGALKALEASRAAPVRAQAKIAWDLFRHSREGLFRLLRTLIYPALLAMALSMFAAMALLMVMHLDSFLRGIARLFSAKWRGIATPLILVLISVAPIFWGPLWSIFVWGAVIVVFVPQRRWLAFLAGAVLVAIAALIPIRETLDRRLADPGVGAVLRAAGGSYRVTDRNVLENYTAANASDPAGWLAYARVLRWTGDFEGALKAAIHGGNLEQGAVFSMEKGLAQYLLGRLDEAEKIFAELESRGESSAEFYFNYSKIKFDQMDTEKSRSLLAEVTESDPELLSAMRAREDAAGDRGRMVVADGAVPLQLVMRSVFNPVEAISPEDYDRVCEVLMPEGGVIPAGSLGVVLIVLFFVVKPPRRVVRRHLLYPEYAPPVVLRILTSWIPGGSWVILKRPGAGFLILCGALLLAMPLVGWPNDASYLFRYFAVIKPYYLSLLSVYLLMSWYVGFYLRGQGRS